MADLLAYFDSFDAEFERARDATGNPCDRYYELGGYSVRLAFAGDGLVSSLAPALAHREAPPTRAPALTVCLWDSSITGVDMALPEWAEAPSSWEAEVLWCDGGRVRTAYHAGLRTLNLLDAERDRAIFWAPSAEEITCVDRAKPLKTILHWWLGDRRKLLVHAAAVGGPHGGVLLTGRGGAGKTTAALACLEAGLRFAGDDYVLLSPGPVPHVESLYSTALLDRDYLANSFPRLLPLCRTESAGSEEKALISLWDHLPEQIASDFPVRAVLVPQIVDRRETRLTELSAAACFRALAPSTLMQLPGGGREAFSLMAQFVRQVPTFALEMGCDLAGVATVIERLLKELPS